MSKSFNNRVMDAAIIPSGFSDYQMITIDINKKTTFRSQHYWHFNKKFLYNKLFCESFTHLWENWRLQKNNYETKSQWWEVGKVHIKNFCQSYESQVSLKIRDTVQNKLERNVVQHNPMLHLRRPDGTIKHNPNEMRKLAVEFYSGLFNAEQCDDESVADICQDLPKLQPKQRETLHSDISLQELTDAVKQLSSGRSPVIDGITTDFYHYFWNVLGQDFYEVVKKCFENGFLPSSCRRAVLSLLPKKGDLGLLKNWRPVSLLCTDYTILAKCLANRLKQYLDTIIHSDQTYCVPERSIMDNLFLLRDAVDLSFKENINVFFYQ